MVLFPRDCLVYRLCHPVLLGRLVRWDPVVLEVQWVLLVLADRLGRLVRPILADLVDLDRREVP